MTRTMGAENKRTKQATSRPSVKDLCWAAGFVEGEGSFHRTPNGSNDICVTQVNYEPIGKLLSLFGGNVKLRHRPTPQQPIWIWRANGARGRGIMMTLYTLMSTKRQEQIRVALR